MSITLTLVRHGESTDNTRAFWAGWRDAPLSNHGHNQARRLADSFKGVPITAIYTSDLARAHSTALAVNSVAALLPEPPPLQVTRLLREQNFGQAEGQPWNANQCSGDDPRLSKFPQGECLQDVAQRAETFLVDVIMPWAQRARQLAAAATAAAIDKGIGDVALDAKVEPLPPTHPAGHVKPVHIAIFAHGIFLSELLYALARAENPLAPYQRRSGFFNTGWTRVEVELLEDLASESGAQADAEAWRVPVPRQEPGPITLLPLIRARLLSINNDQHLAGLKRQKGGIGSSAYSPKQTKLQDFFGGGGAAGT